MPHIDALPEQRPTPAPRPAVVVSGGSPPHPDVRSVLPEALFVVAADSGYAHARSLGLHVDVLVGDFDSLPPADLAVAQRSETSVRRHPVDKDATDLELACDEALAHGSTELTVIAGGEGHRVDHFLATVSLLSDPRYASLSVSAWLGRARIVVVRPAQPALLHQVPQPAGDDATAFVSLVPVTATVGGVRTTGLKFALDRETLDRHRSHGVSNVFVDPTASVEVESGTLLVIQPAALRSASPQ